MAKALIPLFDMVVLAAGFAIYISPFVMRASDSIPEWMIAAEVAAEPERYLRPGE
ncbi:MAG: hypothetical protein WCL50_11225 [Spirochaetota bacterium]